jgi:hypothetical protein
MESSCEVMTRMTCYAKGNKPHLYLIAGIWACISWDGYGRGPTVRRAYENWQRSRA